MTRRFTAATTAVIAGATMLSVLGSSPAHAVSCTSQPVTNNSSYNGQFTYRYSQYNLRTGPSWSCPTSVTVYPLTGFYGWCTLWVNGVAWVYGRVAGYQYYGWYTAVDNLSPGTGSWGYCPT